MSEHSPTRRTPIVPSWVIEVLRAWHQTYGDAGAGDLDCSAHSEGQSCCIDLLIEANESYGG